MKEVISLIGLKILILLGVLKIDGSLRKNADLIKDYVEILLHENQEHNLKDIFLSRLQEDLLDTDFDITTLESPLQELNDIQIYSVETFVI